MIIKGYVFSILYVLVCLLVAMGIYKLGAPKHVTRKIVHILVGFEWVILYHFFGAPSLNFLAVCVLFLLLLLLEYKLSLVPMMSSDGDNAPGTVYYAAAMSIMALVTLFLPNMIYPFGISVFCTSLGDGFAGLAGQAVKRHNVKIWNQKSLVGSIVNFAVCFAVAFVFSRCYGFDLSVLSCIVIAAFALELELFSGKGLDNILITLGVSFLTYSLMYFDRVWSYIVPILLTPLVIALCLKKKALTPMAVVSALMMDIAVSVAFGNVGFVVLIIFFAGSILTDKFKKKRNKTEQSINAESNCRGISQVFANGFIAMLCAVLYALTAEKSLFVMFVAVMAEAFADTVASGIGSSAKQVYDIFRFEKCQRGMSGGVSVVGTLASLLASFLLAAVPLCVGAINAFEFLLVGCVGFVGGFFDSFLGSLVQAKYKCSVCGRVVEKPLHCSEEATLCRGISFVTNSVVNFLSTVFTGLLAFALYCL